MVFDPDLAVSLGDEEECLSVLALLENGVFGQVEQSHDVVDQKVDQIFALHEDLVRHDGSLEDVLRHLLPQAGTDHVQELVQLLLVVEVVLRRHHELSHVILECFRKLHVLHRRIGHVNLLLEPLRLPVEHLGDHGNGSEDVSVDQSSADQQDAGHDELKEGPWVDVIAGERQD